MSTLTKIALVTVLYNSEKHLPIFFESIGNQIDGDFLVVIVDNGSADGSLSLSQKLAALHGINCEFISNSVNVGIAEGNNIGIKHAESLGLQHIVLINNDISCQSDLISKIRSSAIDKGLMAWTCLAYLGDTNLHWYGGGNLSFWRARGMHFTQLESEKIKSAMPVSYAPTCLMYIHGSIFKKIGLMDEQYFVYYDDTDFCKRMNDAGIELIYDPDTSINHYVGGSSGGDLSQFSIRQNTKNKFLYIHKHYKFWYRWVIFLIALISKVVQLGIKNRRKPIIYGLRDAYESINKQKI